VNIRSYGETAYTATSYAAWSWTELG
jgi:hypothetical protein